MIQGVAYFFHAFKVPVRDSTGAIIGLCGFARDVTERRRAEQELKESEARYKALINASTAGIFVIQEECYIFANPAAARLMGLHDPAEIVGMPALDLIAPDYRDRMVEHMANLEAAQPDPPIELRLNRPDGQITFVEIDLDPDQPARQACLVNRQPGHHRPQGDGGSAARLAGVVSPAPVSRRRT